VANGIFNIAKGKIAYYASLPAAADALIAVPIETTGLEADDTLNNYDDLGTLLAASNNEQSTMGRKTLSGVTVTVDDTANTVNVTCTDWTWTAASGNAISKVLICYDGDTGAGTDSNIIPISYHDFVATPDGNDIAVTGPSTTGLFGAS